MLISFCTKWLLVNKLEEEELSFKSAEVVVMCAFNAHFIKEVSREQLSGAAKALLPKAERKSLQGAEKSKFLKPLANAFCEKEIIKVQGSARVCNLCRQDVLKVGTF